MAGAIGVIVQGFPGVCCTGATFWEWLEFGWLVGASFWGQLGLVWARVPGLAQAAS